MRIINVTTQGERDICHAIRRKVFIEEQGVSEAEEVDGMDPACLHYLMQDGDDAVATARVLPKGDRAKIQRVAVLKSHRLRGLGSDLMAHILSDLADQGFAMGFLGAQLPAIPFYQKLGFVVEGDEYLDANIAHRDMKISLR